MAAQVRVGAQPLSYHKYSYKGAQPVNYNTKQSITLACIPIKYSYGCPNESAQPLNYSIFI